MSLPSLCYWPIQLIQQAEKENPESLQNHNQHYLFHQTSIPGDPSRYHVHCQDCKTVFLPVNEQQQQFFKVKVQHYLPVETYHGWVVANCS